MCDERPPNKTKASKEQNYWGLKTSCSSKQKVLLELGSCKHSKELNLTLRYATSKILRSQDFVPITEALLSETAHHYTALYSFTKACLLNKLSLSQLVSDQLPTTLIYPFGARERHEFQLLLENYWNNSYKSRKFSKMQRLFKATSTSL